MNSTTRTKNDDKFLKKMTRALMAWGYNNDNPPDNDVTMSSVQTGKVVESPLPSSGISLHLSTTHSKSTDNTEINPNITPSPPLSPPPSPPPTSLTKSVRKIREKTPETKQTKGKRPTHKAPQTTSRRITTTTKWKQKQKEKEKITSELYESLKRSK